MGFFKRIFSKKPAELTEIVQLAQLREWFATKRQEQITILQRDLDKRLPELRVAIDELSAGIEALREAKLLNPNILERERHFLNGNRDQFLKAAERFKKSITLPATPEALLSFDQHIQRCVKQFSEDIQRAFHILQNFLANETKDVVRQVDAIAKHAESLREIGCLLSRFDELGKAIDDFLRAINDQKRNNEEILVREKKREQLRSELQLAQDAVTRIESSPENKELSQLKSQIQEIATKIKILRQGMIEQFSAIEPALKKYERMTVQHQLVKDYLTNPIETLARDRDLQILHVIAAMRNEVVADRIELKDKKKEKVLATMDLFTSVALNTFLKEYGNLMQVHTKLLSQIDLLPVLHQLAAAKEQVKRITCELNSIEQAPVKRLASADEERIAEARLRVISIAHERGISLRIN